MNITKKTLSNPLLVIMVFILLAVMGLFTFRRIEVNLWPELNEPLLMVSARYENAGPQSVEKSVTRVIEDGLISLSNLKKMTSISSEGYSEITLEFNYGTNLDVASNEVRDAIDAVKDSLPKSVKTPGIMKFKASSSPIMTLAVRGNRSAEELRHIADNEIKGILSQARGVGRVLVDGGRSKIVRVELSQNRLAAFNLSVPQVAAKLALENIDLGGGRIKEGGRNFTVRTSGEFKSIKEINDTVLLNVKGYNVKVRDVGLAFSGYKDQRENVLINGKPGVYISVTKQSGTNGVKVADSLYEKISELEQSLPDDIKLEIISDDSVTIRQTLAMLYENAWQGILLAVLVLFVFLRSFKSTFIISISMPVSIIITLLLMYLSGVSLNLMTLTGLILGIGMVVDASIVMIDNIYSYRIRGSKAKTAAILGSEEMITSVVSGNITTIVVFLPFLLYLKDLSWMGQMAKDMIFTVVMAIISSLFVAVFLVPVLAGHYLPLSNRRELPVRNPFLVKLYSLFETVLKILTLLYKKLLTKALIYRKTTCLISLALLIVSFSLLPFLGIELMEDEESNYVTLKIEEPVGTGYETTQRITEYFQNVAQREIVNYRTIVAATGTADMSGYGQENKASLTVYLPPLKEQKDKASDVERKLAEHFKYFPAAKFSFQNSDMETIAGSDIDIVIRGSNLEDASRLGKKIMEVMAASGKLGNISMDLQEGLPQVEVEIDRQRAAALGVSIESAAIEVNNCIAGVTATKFRQDGSEYDVVLMYQDCDRENVMQLDSVMVQGRNGPVSLNNFAAIKKNLGPVEIKRQNRSRCVHVTAKITGKDTAPRIEAEIKEAMKKEILPAGLNVSYEGSWQSMKKQGSAFAQIIILAILLVFGVMAGTYGSIKAPLINLMTIPFMFIGVIILYFIKGQAVSLMTLLGLVMLVGIVVNNGIILVDYTNLLVKRGTKIKEACIEAGESRFRPVLMTTLTTVLGMLPMCFNNKGSAALVQPIGLGVTGGLLSSTFVTLILIPVLYSMIMREEKIESCDLKLQSYIKTLPELNVFNDKVAACRCEIIGNQSIQEDLIGLLEAMLPDIQYTLTEAVQGRGLRSRKEGTATWPELNFILTAYVSKADLEKVSLVINHIQTRFAGEGVEIFVIRL